MCLAIPGKIISIEGDDATLDYGVEKRKAKIKDKSFAVGDYVIAQGGFIVIKLDSKKAKESLRFIEKNL